MKDDKYMGGPLSAAFVFDKEHNDRLQELVISTSPEICLQETLSNCMMHSVRIDGVSDKRVVVPDLDSIPEPTLVNSAYYYRELLMPVVTALELQPSVEIHSKEVVFAILNDLPIDLGDPKNGIRQRSDYADFVKSFSGGFIDLMGKGTTVKFPSGEEFGFGLQSAATLGMDESQGPKHKVPSVPSPKPKHGIA